jgi:hypothetical protein
LPIISLSLSVVALPLFLFFPLFHPQTTLHERNITGVAFNTDYDAMLCYSGGAGNTSTLTTKIADLPVYKQRIHGRVVSLSGTRVLALLNGAVSPHDIPVASAVARYAEKKEYMTAYRLACFGSTTRDWEQLAAAALKDLELPSAKRCYLRIKKLRYMDLIAELQNDLRQKTGPVSREVMAAKIHALDRKSVV